MTCFLFSVPSSNTTASTSDICGESSASFSKSFRSFAGARSGSFKSLIAHIRRLPSATINEEDEREPFFFSNGIKAKSSSGFKPILVTSVGQTGHTSLFLTMRRRTFYFSWGIRSCKNCRSGSCGSQRQSEDRASAVLPSLRYNRHGLNAPGITCQFAMFQQRVDLRETGLWTFAHCNGRLDRS
jgi:hypothetical protein